MEKRISKENYYLDIAQATLARSTCLRRKYGAVIVNNDEIISTGYNGAPRHRKNCNEIGKCLREELKIPSGQCYEKCRSVHAEQNAIISAPRKDMINGTLYLVGFDMKLNDYTQGTCADCCTMCKRMIINSGISKVIIRIDKEHYKVINVMDWINQDDSIY